MFALHHRMPSVPSRPQAPTALGGAHPKRRIVSALTGWVLLAAVLVSLPVALPAAPTVQAGTPSSISGLHVSGNQILNGAGQAVRLLGVNRAGTEYACIQGWGIFDGPSDAASVQAIAAWKTNAVRVPLNEDCWLGINGVNSAYGGANYQSAVANYVSLLNGYGLVAILDIHWSAPGSQAATSAQPMPDRDHSVTFWQQVATAYKGNSSVVFDLYNEPYPDSNRNTTAAWTCWRDGGTCPGVSFQAAGMQELVTAIRNAGATNIVLAGGVQYANALSQWLTYRPSDPSGNLAASWHVYNFNTCASTTCFDTTIGPVAQQVPIVAGEIGENDCAHGFIDSVMNWLDARKQSYLGWTWDTWSCSSGPALITSYSGTPTQTFGQGFKDHLAALAASPAPTAAASTPTSTPSRTATPTPSTSDTTPPAAPLVSSPSSSVTTGGRTYTIAGTAEANALVRVWVDANSNGVRDPGDTLAGSQQLAGGATAYAIGVALQNNADNRFIVTATDAAGNESPAAPVPTITRTHKQ